MIYAYVVPVTGFASSFQIEDVYAFIGQAERAISTDGFIDKANLDAGPGWVVQGWVGDTSLTDGSPINTRVTQERDRVFREIHGQEPSPNPLAGTVVIACWERASDSYIELPQRWRDWIVRTNEQVHADDVKGKVREN